MDAAECLLYSQGQTNITSNFDFDLLIEWLVRNVPRMRSFDYKRAIFNQTKPLLLNQPSFTSDL